MPISIKCPSCGYAGRVPDMALGRRIKCPKCATPFVVQPESAPAAPPPPSEPDPALDQPSPQQQPLPSAFDHELAAPAPEPKKIESDESSSDDAGETAEAPGSDLPWSYRFIDSYAKVSIIGGIVVATLALLGVLVLAGMTAYSASSTHELVVAIALMAAALLYYLFVILWVLLLAALMMTFVDTSKNMREMLRILQDRK